MTPTTQDTEVWVFLGDSLTEGIGRHRTSYVTELVGLLRTRLQRPIHTVRLRRVDLSSWQHLSHFNLAGQLDLDQSRSESPLWLVNLAAESTTVESDPKTLDALSGLRPSRFIVLRGSLETIVRPASTLDGDWPFWVPRGWRTYAGLDPRCFFSVSPLRRGKQILVDRAKQHIRLQLLAKCGGKPLLDDNTFLAAYEQLLLRIQNSQAPVIVLALPAVDPTIFPGTAELIGRRNTGLRELAARYGADFLEWSPKINNTAGFFCRDGFHPNEWGANAMAKQLLDCLVAKEDVKVVPARHG